MYKRVTPVTHTPYVLPTSLHWFGRLVQIIHSSVSVWVISVRHTDNSHLVMGVNIVIAEIFH